MWRWCAYLFGVLLIAVALAAVRPLRPKLLPTLRPFRTIFSADALEEPEATAAAVIAVQS